MNGEYTNVIKNVSLFALTKQSTIPSNQVVIGSGHSNGATWETWIAYPIILMLLVIACCIIIRQNLDRAAGLIARMQSCLWPILSLFQQNTRTADEDIKMGNINPVGSSDVLLHGCNLSDSEWIRAGAHFVIV